ncbi:hypothetical protein ACS0TY_014476 [Phlomoides rotata]
MVGHNFKACDLYDRNDFPEPVDMEYDPFLKVSPLKKGHGMKVENVSIDTEDDALGPGGSNPNRKTWKHSARDKGKEVSSSEVKAQICRGEKRGAESRGDLMDIDCLSSYPKRDKCSLGVDGEDGVGSDELILSAVDVSGLHCRDQ